MQQAGKGKKKDPFGKSKLILTEGVIEFLKEQTKKKVKRKKPSK